MFKRYDGFFNSVPQKEIDNKLPICPFCGKPAHWLLEVNMGFSSSTIEFMCEQCGARIMQESVGLFHLDMLTVTNIGLKNFANLQFNGAYNISALRNVAQHLLSDTSNSPAETVTEVKNDVEDGKKPDGVYEGSPIVASSPPNKSTAKVFVTIISIAIILFLLLYIIVSVVSCGSSSGLTYDNYIKIHNGMSYSQVTEILGGPGELTTSGGVGDYSLAYYTWQNTSGTKIIVVGFENNKVCAKSQVGLS